MCFCAVSNICAVTLYTCAYYAPCLMYTLLPHNVVTLTPAYISSCTLTLTSSQACGYTYTLWVCATCIAMAAAHMCPRRTHTCLGACMLAPYTYVYAHVLVLAHSPLHVCMPAHSTPTSAYMHISPACVRISASNWLCLTHSWAWINLMK